MKTSHFWNILHLPIPSRLPSGKDRLRLVLIHPWENNQNFGIFCPMESSTLEAMWQQKDMSWIGFIMPYIMPYIPTCQHPTILHPSSQTFMHCANGKEGLGGKRHKGERERNKEEAGL